DGFTEGRRCGRRQVCGRTSAAAKDGCRAIALVYVAIDGHGATNAAPALQNANGYGKVVDHAESLAMLGEGMMKSAAYVEADAVVERALGGQNRAAGVQQESVDHLRRV